MEEDIGNKHSWQKPQTRIYKEHLQINWKKNSNPIEKTMSEETFVSYVTKEQIHKTVKYKRMLNLISHYGNAI